MFKWLYWYATFGFLFFLPGLSIIMAILYGCYVMFSSPLTHPRVAHVSETTPEPVKDGESGEIASNFDPRESKIKAAAFAEEARLLELERHMQKDDQELFAQNNARHSSVIRDASSNWSDSDSWQDRLETEARG